MELYSAGQYRAAADRLGRSAEAAPADDEVQFYRGVSLLLSGEARGAAEVLRRAVRLLPSSSLYRWYLAQAELGCGRRDAAEAELRRIEAAGGDFASEAKALLTRIAEVR
jgi:predicted Zn-dependent protease